MDEHTPSRDHPGEGSEPSGSGEGQPRGGFSRRRFLLAGTAAGATAAMAGSPAIAAAAGVVESDEDSDPCAEVVFINGTIHTMDAQNTITDSVTIRNGRIVAVGGAGQDAPRGTRVINLNGATVIPGIIDAHNHIVLVGNRPGWHIGLEHVFTIPDAVAELQAWSENVPPGEFITTIGPISAMQFAEQRLPLLAELDAVDRPVYLQAAQGGTRTNSAGKAWLEARGVTVAADGVISGGSVGIALRTLRTELLTPESRKRTAAAALQYFAGLGITTHKDAGAFHSEGPATGIASENTYTMHNPFLALNREDAMPARLRIDFLHQDPANSDLPTLAARLRNAFPFFGNDWMRTGGIGEFTGGGINGLRAIAAAGWRAEDHALSLNAATSLIANREIVHSETPIDHLRWIISHIPVFPNELADRFHAIGGGVLVGWGPTRTGTNVGPPYRNLIEHPIPVGWHSDGGDITVISPWLNLYTTITGRNLRGDLINAGQTLTRWEALWLATAANKWFIWEDDLGSIEVGNHADLVVLDRDFFAIPDEEIKHIKSDLTMVGGRIVHAAGDFSSAIEFSRLRSELDALVLAGGITEGLEDKVRHALSQAELWRSLPKKQTVALSHLDRAVHLLLWQADVIEKKNKPDQGDPAGLRALAASIRSFRDSLAAS